MALRAERHTNLDKLLFALKEHNTENQLMIQRGKRLRQKEVYETNFTVTKGKAARAKPTNKDGKPFKGRTFKKSPSKGWASKGKILPCFACGKSGHLAKECQATPEEQKEYLFHFHVQRHKNGIESHGTEVQPHKEPSNLVGTTQTVFSVNATSVNNFSNPDAMDLDEIEMMETLDLEDGSRV
jgi:hypothetical protein